MTERDFLQAIQGDPDEVGNYLVYADWLEDQGEEDRARLIRVNVELQGDRSPRGDQLWNQVVDQRAKVDKSWAAVRKWLKHFNLDWHLGIPSGLGCAKLPAVRSLRALPELPSVARLKTSAVPAPEAFAALRDRSDVRRLVLTGGSPDFDALARLTDLEGLAFDYNPITESDLARLLPLKKLRSLNLYDSPIGDSGAALLPSFPLLEELELTMTGITDASMEHLAKSKQLERLSIDGNPITDAGLQRLAGLKGLTHLKVGETELTESSLEVLLKFKKLRSLDLGRLRWVNDTNLTRFAVLRDLRELDLRRTCVSRYNLRRNLKRFPKLKHVRLEGNLDEYNSSEVRAFQEDMRESDYFVEMDFE